MNPTEQNILKEKWIMIRKGEIRNVFNSRKEAIKHFKELLRQTLKDFENQDRTYEYDYPIEIPETIFKKLNERSADLSLL